MKCYLVKSGKVEKILLNQLRTEATDKVYEERTQLSEHIRSSVNDPKTWLKSSFSLRVKVL
ncbi:MAG: hypothetical protein PUP93_19355 [Rhizonema sp. NSF051]|nr:hypothetical protein [Rhizonema sp. NSF051]